MKVSASKENHLKAIFHLQQEQGIVTTNALAAALADPACICDGHAEEAEGAEVADLRALQRIQTKCRRKEGSGSGHPQTPFVGIFPRKKITVWLGRGA